MNSVRIWTVLAVLFGAGPAGATASLGMVPDGVSLGVPSEVILVVSQGANRLALIEPGVHAPQQVVRVQDDPSVLVFRNGGDTAAILHKGDSKVGEAVTLFSLRLGRVLRVIDLANEANPEASLFGPCAAAFEPDGAHLLLCVESSPHLYRVSTGDGKYVPLLNLGAAGASDIVSSADGRFAWVSYAESGTLVVCDLLRGRVLRRISLGGGTSAIALHPDGHELWAANALTNSISVVDLDTNREVLEFPVGSQPWSLDFTPDGDSVLVIHRHGGSATLFDSKRRAVMAEIKLGPPRKGELGEGAGYEDVLGGPGVLPSSVSIAPDGRKAHVTCEGTDELVTLSLAPLAIERRRPIGRRPTAVCHAVLGVPSGS